MWYSVGKPQEKHENVRIVLSTAMNSAENQWRQLIDISREWVGTLWCKIFKKWIWVLRILKIIQTCLFGTSCSNIHLSLSVRHHICDAVNDMVFVKLINLWNGVVCNLSRPEQLLNSYTSSILIYEPGLVVRLWSRCLLSQFKQRARSKVYQTLCDVGITTSGVTRGSDSNRSWRNQNLLLWPSDWNQHNPLCQWFRWVFVDIMKPSSNSV